MKREEYLARLNYSGTLSPTHEALSALQEAHLLAVPFENLDIHNGTNIVLEPARLFRKIVVLRRGGFCYELNGLFNWLLRELGFHVRLCMGRVYDRNRAAFGPDFDHMLNLVEVDGKRWVVDVGFGDFSMHPLEVVLDRAIADQNGLFLIEQETGEFLRVSRFSRKDERYVPEYLFSEKERRLEDFSAMCLHHQTSPDSHFTQKKICSIATAAGRITLTDDRLIVTDMGERTESLIGNEQEFTAALARYFNIIL